MCLIQAFRFVIAWNLQLSRITYYVFIVFCGEKVHLDVEGRLAATAESEILMTVHTPSANMRNGARGSALRVEAELHLMDIFEDSRALGSLKTAFDHSREISSPHPI